MCISIKIWSDCRLIDALVTAQLRYNAHIVDLIFEISLHEIGISAEVYSLVLRKGFFKVAQFKMCAVSFTNYYKVAFSIPKHSHVRKCS